MSELPLAVQAGSVLQGLLGLLQAQGAMASIKDAASGRYVWANEALLRWLGQPAERVLGASDLDLLPLADASAVRAGDQRALAAGPMAIGEHRFERAGQRHEFRTWRCMVYGPDGKPQLLSLWLDEAPQRRQAAQLQQALTQIERHQAAIEQVRRQAPGSVDRPSELFRREHFEEHLRREVALSLREQREFALVLMAVDRFDELRRSRGEAAVQRVIESIGQLMRANTRAMDVLCQLAEDRYAILLSGVGLATAHSRMEQLRRACTSQLVVQDGQSFQFELSVGVSSFPHTAETLEQLSQAAIRALQDARLRGGNRVALASISLAELLPTAA